MLLMKNINERLFEITSMEGLPDYLIGDDITYFKFAPITSTNIERSFSKYKTLVLLDNYLDKYKFG